MPTAHVTPLAVRDTKAAAMLDMTTSEFRRLVERGALPPPTRIGGHERWRVDQIEAILRADAALPDRVYARSDVDEREIRERAGTNHAHAAPEHRRKGLK